MNAKQHLESLKLLDARIEQRIRQLDDLKKRRSYIIGNSTALGACPESVFESGGKILTELQAEISENIIKFERQRNDIINRIQSLNNHKFMRVLYKRYVEYKPFEQIAAELGYARSHTLLLHRNAVEALEKVFG